ncbi:hypothetical protein GCM10027598_45470 [Amycolatopsis oliviviridis]|uniref:XRE family transcriptional regulator n=1 Tax=Amycolatopsis oliviviridis TaxID=1471590 RepID=A0ABQ3L9M0_9PSEU|nr:hypothetical protein [Amycolatopsis oliviviridis]GHH08951.1 hypothetical protein GCM10017790_16360 [Amycolatopsis oliviviridis]
MTVSAADLAGELKQLRRGRGIAAPQLAERAGPALRAVCGTTEDDENAAIRRRLTECLSEWTRALPDDLRTAVLAAFGLHPDAVKPFYQDRVRWLAKYLERDDRTARRRIDEGMDRLAEVAVASTSESDAEASRPSRRWHTEDLRVTLALDQPIPEAFEFRRIVADADEITELDLALTLTDSVYRGEAIGTDDLRVDVFHGGLLIGRAMESTDRVGLALRLPEPLRRHSKHEIALRFRAEIRHPHFVCVPRHPVDQFDLHVRFARPMPTEVVKLERVFQDDASDDAARGDSLIADASGEVHVHFRGLEPGFAYGVRWKVPESGSRGLEN